MTVKYKWKYLFDEHEMEGNKENDNNKYRIGFKTSDAEKSLERL